MLTKKTHTNIQHKAHLEGADSGEQGLSVLFPSGDLLSQGEPLSMGVPELLLPDLKLLTELGRLTVC